ncbi:MAG: tetratricopeptide repeat protein, partial [Gemmatimonadetes bacterium]|nr:tetratricopeptide repeat protein [Gemmatimonadota bacterium]
MRKLFDEVKARLAAFLDQREYAVLAVCSAEDEAVVIGKILEGLDEERGTEMFWLSTDEFRDRASYVGTICNSFAVKHGGVSLALQKDGAAPWPPLPLAVLDETADPVARLRATLEFSRQLLPAPEGFRAVWGFYPSAIADHREFALLLWELLQHEFPLPWFHHLRLVVRAERGDAWVRTALADLPHTDWYDPDLSPAAMQRALHEEAVDPKLPLERRLQNVLISAHMDYGHQRFGDAMRKFVMLLRYYTATRNPTMTAVTLNGMGEVHHRVGNDEQAANCWEEATVPIAGEANPPVPVLLNVVLNLANLRLSQQRYAEAEGYYDSAQQLATLQRAGETKVRCLENLGVCQHQQGKWPEAEQTWWAGATVAGELKLPEHRRNILLRLRSLYAEAGDHGRRYHVEQELSSL